MQEQWIEEVFNQPKHELTFAKRTHCKFMYTVDGVLFDGETYAFCHTEIVAQIREIYIADAEIRVFLVQWDFD